MGLIDETCSLLRPLSASTNGGLIIGTSLYNVPVNKESFFFTIPLT